MIIGWSVSLCVLSFFFNWMMCFKRFVYFCFLLSSITSWLESWFQSQQTSPFSNFSNGACIVKLTYSAFDYYVYYIIMDSILETAPWELKKTNKLSIHFGTMCECICWQAKYKVVHKGKIPLEEIRKFWLKVPFVEMFLTDFPSLGNKSVVENVEVKKVKFNICRVCFSSKMHFICWFLANN